MGYELESVEVSGDVNVPNQSDISYHKRLADIPPGEILVRGVRYKDGHEYTLEHCHRSVESALNSLVLFELAYGGRFEPMGIPDTITVKTSVMDCIDFTSFTGTADDMESLTNLADIATKNLGGVSKGVMASFSSESGPLECAVSGLAGGRMTTREVLITALYKFTLPYKKTKLLSVKDLLTLYVMLKVEKVPLEDVLSLFEE